MDTSSNYMENRDVEYETSNTIYDECYERNGIKCKNYKLCQHILPPDHYEMLIILNLQVLKHTKKLLLQ